MNTVAQFDIADCQTIKILIPEFEKKENLFYEPIVELHRYDVVQTVLQLNIETFLLGDYDLEETIAHFSINITQLLNNELVLQFPLEIGEVSLNFSKRMYYEEYKTNKIDIFQRYWFLSTNTELQTWAYNVGKKMYIEVSPTYHWLFDEPEEGEVVVPFEEYVKTYQPVAVLEISSQQAEDWLKKCKEIEKILEETRDKPQIKPDTETYYINEEELFKG